MGGQHMLEHWRAATPELTPVIRLLLLFSRVRLSQDHVARAHRLMKKVEDWEDFANRAADHFLAPLCLHHLVDFAEVPEVLACRRALVPHVRKMTFHILKHAALQRRFVDQHVVPLQCKYVVVKGRALAARYYPDSNLRYARDVDILIPRECIDALILSAQKDGYLVYPQLRPLSAMEAKIVSGNSAVVSLLGPDNIFLEVHAQLDKAGFLLDHRQVLENGSFQLVDGVDIGMPSTLDHFVYICLHHTKHFWSRLNWLADLDAIVQSPDFDEQATLAFARSRGLEATIRACIAFYRACAEEAPVEALSEDAEASDLLRACLVILGGGSESEFHMRPDRLTLDFNFAWQIPAGFRARQAMFRALSLLKPSLHDYGTLKLPRSMYWAYFPIKPVLVGWRRLHR